MNSAIKCRLIYLQSFFIHCLPIRSNLYIEKNHLYTSSKLTLEIVYFRCYLILTFKNKEMLLDCKRLTSGKREATTKLCFSLLWLQIEFCFFWHFLLTFIALVAISAQRETTMEKKERSIGKVYFDDEVTEKKKYHKK